MSLGATAWLWMLAAAVIPIAIHLWSRKSGQPKMLPTFRFLPDKSVARASRIQLHEKLLLAVRLLLILLVTLLLTGLFINSEPVTYNTVRITEADTLQTSETADGLLELQFSSDFINRIGWFRLVEQTDYDYSPGLIIVEGNLTANRFSGQVPNISADIEWIASNLPDEMTLSSWMGRNETAYQFVRSRPDGNVESRISRVNSSDADSLNSLRLAINQNTKTTVKTAIEQSAALWGVDVIEDELPLNVIARADFGNTESVLVVPAEEKNTNIHLEPSPQFGIDLPVNVTDSLAETRENSRLNTPFTDNILKVSGISEITLRADPDVAFAEWFYSGVIHRLMTTALGIETMDGPVMTSQQLKPLQLNRAELGGFVEKKSAIPYLIGAMLIIWAFERLLSIKRGM